MEKKISLLQRYSGEWSKAFHYASVLLAGSSWSKVRLATEGNTGYPLLSEVKACWVG